ncbi:hypothetical protein BC567DRAFT_43906 [Phyllosticta citribraziliensis]
MAVPSMLDVHLHVHGVGWICLYVLYISCALPSHEPPPPAAAVQNRIVVLVFGLGSFGADSLLFQMTCCSLSSTGLIADFQVLVDCPKGGLASLPLRVRCLSPFPKGFTSPITHSPPPPSIPTGRPAASPPRRS